jgi:hypothetical protein
MNRAIAHTFWRTLEFTGEFGFLQYCGHFFG